MKTYAIIRTTDLYHANRDNRFNANGVQVLQTGLTLKEAQRDLLERFFDTIDKYIPNWGIAVSMSTLGLEARRTNEDGTRCYEDDIYTYSICPETDEDVVNYIFKEVGGTQFARMFDYFDGELTFDPHGETQTGCLTDEVVDLDALEVRSETTGHVQKCQSVREVAEYLYELYNAVADYLTGEEVWEQMNGLTTAFAYRPQGAGLQYSEAVANGETIPEGRYYEEPIDGEAGQVMAENFGEWESCEEKQIYSTTGENGTKVYILTYEA